MEDQQAKEALRVIAENSNLKEVQNLFKEYAAAAPEKDEKNGR